MFDPMTRRSRRSVLAALTAATATLAGCSGTDGGDTSAAPESTVGTTTVGAATTTGGTATPTETTTAADDSLPTTGPPLAGVQAFEDAVPALMREWNLPGGSVAVAKGDRLVFARGYGYADREAERPVRPASLFRVASISKPITAVAVLDLLERGALALDDRAFEILDHLVPEGGPADDRVSDVTVGHLLRHTGGWSVREMGYDPMFETTRIARELGVEPPANAAQIIRHTLGQPLSFAPGEGFAYSNVGYCVLGRIVEAVTGADYERHVAADVLDAAGVSRMQVGATRRSNLADGEVRYYGHRTVDSVFPDAGEVASPYGATSLEANDANGGWIGSGVDLLRFLTALDGRGSTGPLLERSTRETLARRPSIDRWRGTSQFYGTGWYVIPGDAGRPSLWHNGSLAGSYGYLVRLAEPDLTLAALFNSRPAERFREFNRTAQQTLNRAAVSVSDWPDRDLFGAFD